MLLILYVLKYSGFYWHGEQYEYIYKSYKDIWPSIAAFGPNTTGSKSDGRFGTLRSHSQLSTCNRIGDTKQLDE